VRLSIVIPTLNEEEYLRSILDRLPDEVEIIVVDGGSTDDTVGAGKRPGVRVLRSDRGRGVQMHAGACASTGDAIWFLHADSKPEPDAPVRILAALANPEIVAGNFSLRFEGKAPGARFLNWLYPRLGQIGLRYGDSGIFVRRSTYEAAGGFAPYPIFEDIDLLRRLRGHGRFVTLATPLTTSSRRFEGRSFTHTFVRWCAMQVLYWAGVHPCTIARMYEPIRLRK
jgi:rSAM/selenodomain-associated transferase 2